MLPIHQKLGLQLAKRKRKPADMKIRWILVLGLFVAALISCQCLRKRSGQSPVQIDEHSILVPGTAISSADQEALNKIFRKYDSSVYRIAVYEGGSLKKQIGEMEAMYVDDVTKDYAQNATAVGLTSWINQLGVRTHVTRFPPTRPGGTTHVTHPGGTTHVTRTANTTHVTTGQPTHVTTGQGTHVTTGEPTHVTHLNFASLEEESDALVKEVTPILEKYSK